MITINAPSKRIANAQEPEIEAPFGIDFHLANGDRMNVRLSPHGEGILITKKSDESVPDIPLPKILKGC